MEDSAEQKFYEKHRALVSNLNIDLEKSLKDIKTLGNRYFCVADYITDAKQKTALEWGFGDPGIFLNLCDIFKEYTAVDIAASSILASLPYSPDNATCIECNLNNDLEVEDDSFDVVIAMMVVEHLFDPFHSFREMSRLVKPGGYVFVNLPIITSIKSRLALLAGNLPVTSRKEWWEDEEWDGGHLHYFDMKHVRKLGEKYSLSLEKVYTVGKYPRVKEYFPGLLCSELSFVFQK